MPPMSYDPFARGPHPVGVRTTSVVDPARDRRLAVEVWYPAAAAHVGQDLDPATRDRYQLVPGIPESYQHARRDAAPLGERAPLAVFSHGLWGHRRQSTFLTTHLASHGWIVVGLDHTGNTSIDLISNLGRPAEEGLRASMVHRPGDVRAVIDAAADGRLGVEIDAAHVGLTGHSFGGWTALRVVPDEPRVAAVVALAPAAGISLLRPELRLPWARPVPVLTIACDRDSLLPLAGIEAMFDDLAPPRDLVVLENADHMHFCDAARETHELFRSMGPQIMATATPMPPFDELVPAKHGHETAAGLGLAHLDAHVRGIAAARELVAGDLAGVLGPRGIAARSRR